MGWLLWKISRWRCRFTWSNSTSGASIDDPAYQVGHIPLTSTIDQDKLARYGEKYLQITSRGLAVKTIRDKGLFAALKLARKKRR